MEGKIFKAMAEAMADVEAVAKDQLNKQQGFKFRSIDAVYNAIQPALTKHHIFISPEVLELSREERQTKTGGTLIYTILKVGYTFYTDDGSSVTVITYGEGMDSADKSINKAMAAAFKYACFQTFCIPTEDLQDPDADAHDVKPKEKKNEVSQPKSGESSTTTSSLTDNNNTSSVPTFSDARRMLKDRKIDENYVCSLYNVPSLEVMSDRQKINLFNNIAKLEQKYLESLKEVKK